MKYPKIDELSKYSKEHLVSWIKGESNKYFPKESQPISVMLLPIAKREIASQMVIETLKQVRNFETYKRIVVVGCCTDVSKRGIFTVENDSYDNELLQLNSIGDDTFLQTLNSIKIKNEISYNAFDILDNSEIAYNFPLITEVSQQKIPIIPLLYHNVDEEELFKIFEVLTKDKTLIIVCTDLSHSLSANETKSLDAVTISKIIALDDSVKNIQCTAYTALNAIIQMSDIHYWRPKLLSYRSTCSEVKRINIAGFASVVFYK